MSVYEPPAPDPDAVFTRLHQISDELGEIVTRMLPGLFPDPAAPDAKYCRYNLQHANLCVTIAANRITSPTVEPTGPVPDQ